MSLDQKWPAVAAFHAANFSAAVEIPNGDPLRALPVLSLLSVSELTPASGPRLGVAGGVFRERGRHCGLRFPVPRNSKQIITSYEE